MCVLTYPLLIYVLTGEEADKMMLISRINLDMLETSYEMKLGYANPVTRILTLQVYKWRRPVCSLL